MDVFLIALPLVIADKRTLRLLLIVAAVAFILGSLAKILSVLLF